MHNRIPEIASEHISQLGECPVWDATSKCISWVDILGGEILGLSVNNSKLSKFNTGQQIGSIACRQSGGFVAAIETGFALIDPVNGIMEPIERTATSILSGRFNDGKCDPSGRFWAGTISETGKGSLYMLDGLGEVSLKTEGITCSNGLAWDPVLSHMYYIDTPSRDIFVYDYSETDGTITNKRVAFTVEGKGGLPDGMTIDADGMLWLAMWDGWQLQKWDPVQAKLLEKISLPISRPTSCAFGGEELRDLYITSAASGLDAVSVEQPHAGKLFLIRDAGQGLPAAKYRG